MARAVSTTFQMVGAIAQTGLATINLGIAINAVVEEYQSSYNGRVSTHEPCEPWCKRAGGSDWDAFQ